MQDEACSTYGLFAYGARERSHDYLDAFYVKNNE